MASRPRPDDLITLLRAGESAKPRLVWYAEGERIELSGRVLATWAAKAADLLQEDLDAGVGTRVALVGPPHWRFLAWALAAWTVGATVVLDEATERSDVLLISGAELASSSPGTADEGDDSGEVGSGTGVVADVTDTAGAVVALTLPALARRSPVDLPAGVIDEAAVLNTYADEVDPYDRAEDDDIALEAEEDIAYADLIGAAEASRVHCSGTESLGDVLLLACATWAAGGSVVLTDPAWERAQGGDPRQGAFADVLRSEGVDLTAPGA